MRAPLPTSTRAFRAADLLSSLLWRQHTLHVRRYGYALLPFALSFLATQQANAVMQLPSSHSTDQRRAPPPTDPIDEADGAQTCYPINWEECEECELSEEWTEYYGEEIWLCARN